MASSPSQTNPIKRLNPLAVPFQTKSKTTHYYYCCASPIHPQLLPHQFFIDQPTSLGFSYTTQSYGPFIFYRPEPTAKPCSPPQSPPSRSPPLPPPQSTSHLSRRTRACPMAKVWTRKRTSTDKSSPVKQRGRGFDPDKTARSFVIPFPHNLHDLRRSRKTTLMIKNIPNQFW